MYQQDLCTFDSGQGLDLKYKESRRQHFPDSLFTCQQMEHISIPAFSRVAICGGTHGNELSGVYVVREMQKRQKDKVGSASLTTVLSNPRAVEICRRYVDTDLNRCFTDALLR